VALVAVGIRASPTVGRLALTVIVTPDERIYVVPAENRVYVVPYEDRTHVVPKG
jgi:hypothetical protein